MPAPFPRETPETLHAVRRQFVIDATSPSGIASVASGRPIGFLDAGYWRVRLAGMQRPGNRLGVHRVVWALHHGAWPTMALDHIDGDGRCNRIENLREATAQMNSRNIVGTTAANTSGFPGVSPHRKGGWQATVRLSGANVYAGHFACREAAFVAAFEAKQRVHPDAIGFFAAWRPAYEACCLRVATERIFGEPRASIFGGPSA